MEEKLETLNVDTINIKKTRVRMPQIERGILLKITAAPTSSKGRTRGNMYFLFVSKYLVSIP